MKNYLLILCGLLLLSGTLKAGKVQTRVDTIEPPTIVISPEISVNRPIRYLNFNPVFKLTGKGDNDYRQEIEGIFKEATIFTIYQHHAPAVEQVIWSLVPASGAPEVMTTQRLADLRQGKVINFTIAQPDEVFVSHYFRNTRESATGAYRLQLGHFDDPAYSLPASAFRGLIGETRVYDFVLSTRERTMVHTYYALKYGKEQNGAAVEYLSGTGRKLWSKGQELPYHYRLTGLGRDDVTGLYQKQSQAASAPDLLTIGLGEIAATNEANPYELDNKGYLLWADDDGDLKLNTPYEGIAPMGVRRWKFTATGIRENLNLALSVNARRWTRPDHFDQLWLCLDRSGAGDFGAAATDFYPLTADGEGGMYAGREIPWRGEDDAAHFTFLAGSRVQPMVWKQGFACEDLASEGRLTIRVMGGRGPLNLRLIDQQGLEAQSWEINVGETVVSTHLAPGNYELEVRDRSGLVSQQAITTCPAQADSAAEEEGKRLDYYLGPNPTIGGDFTFTVRLPTPGPIKVSLYDYLGREINKREYTLRDYLEHDGYLPVRGAYLLRVAAAGEVLQLPIVRQ